MNIQLIIAAVIATLLLSLGAGCKFLYDKNNELRTDLATQKTITETIQNLSKLKDAAITEQNRKIDELATIAQDRQKKAEQAREQARIFGEANVKMANLLLRMKPKTDNVCKESESLIDMIIEKETAK
jgi:hypothetical protein